MLSMFEFNQIFVTNYNYNSNLIRTVSCLVSFIVKVGKLPVLSICYVPAVYFSLSDDCALFKIEGKLHV